MGSKGYETAILAPNLKWYLCSASLSDVVVPAQEGFNSGIFPSRSTPQGIYTWEQPGVWLFMFPSEQMYENSHTTHPFLSRIIGALRKIIWYLYWFGFPALLQYSKCFKTSNFLLGISEFRQKQGTAKMWMSIFDFQFVKWRAAHQEKNSDMVHD